MWIKTTDASGNSGDQWYSDHGLVDGEISGIGNDYGTAIGGGYFKLGIGNPDTTLTSTEKINDGNWHQVTATWNSGTGAMKIYVDGVLNASGTGPTGARNAVVNGLHIGNSHDGGNYFIGTLDDVELYNRVLDPTEIATLATGPAAAIYGFEQNLLDNSGNTNNGTLNGTLTYPAGVVGNYAAQFNGSNSWVSIPISIGTTNFSIAMWIKTTDASGNSGDQWYSDHGLVDGEIPGVVNDFGTAIGGGYFKLGIGNPDTTLTSTEKINDGNWHQVTATWNSGTGAMQIYVDGVLNVSGTGPTGPRNAVVNGLHIGNSHDGGHYFTGTLDEVELYNRVLAPAEIAQLVLGQVVATTPTGVTATGGTNQVVVQWNGVAGATNYVISRALDLNGTYSIIGSSGTATNFTDTVVSYGMTYYYSVASQVNGNTSAYSPAEPAVSLNPYVLFSGLPFAKGADVSSESQMEAAGYTWENEYGTQQDIYGVLTNYGVNAVRFKVWVTNLVSNPGCWNNQADVVAKALRAKNDGLRVLIDFHCSDTWADGSDQYIPASWTNYTTPQLITALYNHIYGVLSALKAEGVTAEWVQVGNEIPCGMLYTNGDRCSYNYLQTLTAMINAGYDAVKAVNTATKVVIHLNDGQVNYQWWYDPMVNLGLKFDVIGMSLYPSTTTNWISDTTAGLNNLLYCNARYGKEVMVCETGLAEDAPQECQNMLVDLMNKTASVPDNKGLGVFYWEPESIYWGAGCYGFPGAVGIPTVAMNAFMYGTHQGDAPAAVYGFENNVLDSSGNGNNGTVNGSLTYTDGEVGDYAAQFNGINSWISIPDSIGSTSFTISLWINTTDGYGNEGDQWYEDHGLVDGEMPGVGNDFGTAIGGGYFKLGIGNPDTTLTSTVPVNDGTWHHVVATWNSTTGAMQIFLDGVLNASGTGPTGARTAVSNGLHIGNSHDGGNYFDGLLDDVELYNGIVPFPAELGTL